MACCAPGDIMHYWRRGVGGGAVDLWPGGWGGVGSGGGAVGLWPGGGGGGGGGAVGFWPGGRGAVGFWPGGGGVPSGKEGKGGALYYMNGLQLPPVSAHAFVSSR